MLRLLECDLGVGSDDIAIPASSEAPPWASRHCTRCEWGWKGFRASYSLLLSFLANFWVPWQLNNSFLVKRNLFELGHFRLWYLKKIYEYLWFCTFYEHLRLGRFSKYLLISHILLGSVAQWLECFYFAPCPGLVFRFCHPLFSLVDPSSKQTHLLVLSGTHLFLSATVLFLLPLIPHSWVIIPPSLLVRIPYILPREEELILMKCFPWAYYFTESLESLLCKSYISPTFRWQRFRKLLICLKPQSWKVAKLGFGIFNPNWFWLKKSMAYTPHTPRCLLKFYFFHESPLVTLL